MLFLHLQFRSLATPLRMVRTKTKKRIITMGMEVAVEVGGAEVAARMKRRGKGTGSLGINGPIRGE